MNWLLIALLSYVLYAVVNIIEKFIIDKRVKNPLVYLLWANILGAFTLIALIALPFTFPKLPLHWLAAILAGVFYFVASLVYLRLLQVEEISRISLWSNMTPIFTLLISLVLLGEQLSSVQIFSFALLLIGGIVASLKKELFRMRMSRNIFLAMIMSLLIAGYFITVRFASNSSSSAALYLIITCVTTFLTASLLVSRKIRRSFHEETRSAPKQLIGATFLAVAIESLGLLLSLWSLSLGPASLISALGGFQSLMVIIFVVMLSMIAPRVIKERFDVFSVTIKLVALVLMVSGVALLYTAT